MKTILDTNNTSAKYIGITGTANVQSSYSHKQNMVYEGYY